MCIQRGASIYIYILYNIIMMMMKRLKFQKSLLCANKLHYNNNSNNIIHIYRERPLFAVHILLLLLLCRTQRAQKSIYRIGIL